MQEYVGERRQPSPFHAPLRISAPPPLHAGSEASRAVAEIRMRDPDFDINRFVQVRHVWCEL